LTDASVPTDPPPSGDGDGGGATGTTGTVTLNVNGERVAVSARHPHLLSALRDELGLTAAKDGCAPSGQCGCCTVLVDGKAVVSCNLPLSRAEGKVIVTLEGLAADELERYGAAFAAHGAVQCGFCTPGIVIRAKSLLDRKGSELRRADAARHLGAHLCRCTGYAKVLDAIEALARGEEHQPEAPGGIGSSGRKHQASDLAIGARPFIDDLTRPGMLHGALRLADHARATVTAIDTAAAAAAPGVEAVLTAADVPGELRTGLIHTDWPCFIPVGGRTSYLGDVLAIVVATDRLAALAAAELIEVGYDVHRPITDPAEAVASGDDAVWGLAGNVLSRSTYQRGGDVEKALEASAQVIHEVFETQRVEQAFLEPESTLAEPRADGTLHVWSGGQGIWDDRDQIASVLGIEPERVTVELVSNGGAFGGKEDLSNQAQTALAAFLTGRPVRCTLTRTQSFHLHAKRHPIRIETWAGCDAEGRLTALKSRMLGDSGPYASVGMKVLERAAGHASGPYVVPVIDVEAVAARTNNPVCGAFRGFGANQAQFAMEGVMDRLAAAVGIDGMTMRRRNVVTPGVVWGPGQRMDDGCRGAEACLDAIRPHYEAARAAGKAVGIGLGLKNSGLGNGVVEVARAVIHHRGDGQIEVRHCWTEMGQGVDTVALQVVVEELGVEPDRIEVVVDTTRELGAGQTTGSRGTLMVAGSVAAACAAAREGGCRIGVDYPGEYRVDWTDPLGSVEEPVIHSTFGYAAQLVIVDRETGTVERVVAAHDVGRAVNPQLCVGQVEGAVHMGLGYALTESFPTDDEARLQATTLRALHIIRPKDMPPVEVILVESPQPDSPYGIKGVGEIGLVPTAGAVAAALHDLDGAWRNRLPMNQGADGARL
jgi:xanthine dehydrogenase molybdenum-binding subunit